MHRCLELARRGAGHVSPNPMVGCVVVGAGGEVLGEGWHGRYGGPHAEVEAIRQAEARHGAEKLREATLFVNLEPCAHHGKTPPCADLIVEKNIPRVVVGMVDPFEKVAGRGVEKLRAAGVEVTVGAEERACRRLNAAFVQHVTTGRPLVHLKIAQTLDACVATRTGDSFWVTGEAARARVHTFRATHDAVLVGSGTARSDDPALTVRTPDTSIAAPRQPRRVVLDRTGTLPSTLALFTDTHAPRTVAVTAPGALPPYADALCEKGGQVLEIPEHDGHLDLGVLLDALGRGDAGRIVQSLLVEGGPGLSSALLAAGLVDRFSCFIAPKLLGDGKRSVRLPSPTRMSEARTWADPTWETVGDDVLFTGWRLER